MKAKVVPIADAPKLPTIAEGRRRVLAAQARRLELKARREAGELRERSEMDLIWSRQIVAARTALLGIPSRFKQRVPHVTTAELAILDELLREALEALGASPAGADIDEDTE